MKIDIGGGGRTGVSDFMFQDIAAIPLAPSSVLADRTETRGARMAAASRRFWPAVVFARRFPSLSPPCACWPVRSERGFSAFSCLVIVSAALIASVGVSMALVAFLAGCCFQSEYRHAPNDIEPFRGS